MKQFFKETLMDKLGNKERGPFKLVTGCARRDSSNNPDQALPEAGIVCQVGVILQELSVAGIEVIEIAFPDAA